MRQKHVLGFHPNPGQNIQHRVSCTFLCFWLLSLFSTEDKQNYLGICIEVLLHNDWWQICWINYSLWVPKQQEVICIGPIKTGPVVFFMFDHLHCWYSCLLTPWNGVLLDESNYLFLVWGACSCSLLTN